MRTSQRQKHVPHFDKHRCLKYIHFISLYIAETTKIISFSSVMHFHTTRKKFVLLKSYICSLTLSPLLLPFTVPSLCSTYSHFEHNITSIKELLFYKMSSNSKICAHVSSPSGRVVGRR